MQYAFYLVKSTKDIKYYSLKMHFKQDSLRIWTSCILWTWSHPPQKATSYTVLHKSSQFSYSLISFCHGNYLHTTAKSEKEKTVCLLQGWATNLTLASKPIIMQEYDKWAMQEYQAPCSPTEIIRVSVWTR